MNQKVDRNKKKDSKCQCHSNEIKLALRAENFSDEKNENF